MDGNKSTAVAAPSRLAIASAVASLLVGGLVLAGWVFDSPLLTVVDSKSVTLKPNAALCFVLYGAALLLLQLAGRRCARAATVCTAILGGIALLTLVEYATGWDFGIDGIFTRGFRPELGGAHPRMGPYSALCFTLTAVALGLMGGQGENRHRPMILAWLGSLVMVIGLYVGLGYMGWLTVSDGWWNLARTGVYMTPLFVLAGGGWLAIAWRESGERWLIERWITVGFLAGLALLVGVAAVSHMSTKYLVVAGDRVNYSHEIFARASQLRSSLDEYRSGLRHFEITGNADLLPLSQQAIPDLLKQVHELRELTVDNAGQQQRIGRLGSQIEGWLKMADEAIRSRTSPGFEGEAAPGASGEGEVAVHAIHRTLREIEDEERQLLEGRSGHSWSATKRTFALLPIGTVLSLVLLVTGMFRLNRVMAARQRGDEALLRNGRQLRLALEAAEIGEWELDLVTQTMHRSPRFDQIFGYSGERPPSDWSYELFLSHVHPADRARVDRICQDSLRTGGDWAFECRIVRVDGSAGWVWARGAAVKNESGQLVEMLGMIRDISDQKNTEAELLLTTDRFQRALKDSPITLFNQDPDLRYTWIYNPALGYDSTEVIGTRDTDLFERAEDAAVTEAIKTEVIRTGMGRREEVLVHCQGVDRYYDLVVDPLLDAEGNIAGVTCVGVDITERKQAETDLEVSRNVLKLALEAAQFGISDWDLATGRMVWSDLRKAMSGLPPDTEMSYEISMGTVHPDDRAQLEAAKTLLLDTEVDGREEYRTLWSDGTVRWLYAQGRIFADAAGRPVRYIGITLDITARKQAEELLARQAAELGLLYATAPVGLFFFDSDLRIVRVNRELAELNGLAVEQHIGRTMRELSSPELADVVEPLLRQVIETGEPILEYEVHGTTVPGSDDPQRHWLVSYHPVQAEDGTIRGVHGVLLEITKRKQVEEALRKSEAAERARRYELEALMDAMPVAIVIARDASNLRMTANRAAEKLLRLPHGQNPSHSGPEAGRPDFQVWSAGRLLAPEELPMQRATTTGEPLSGAEMEVVFPDGERKALLASAFPLFDEAGTVRGCIGAFVDITVRKRRELNVTFLEEMQTALASITRPVEIMRLTGRRIAEHLQLDHCLFVETNEAADQATVLYDHRAGDGPGLEGVYRLKDFHTEDELREMAAGRMIIVDDVSHVPRPTEQTEHFKALEIGSLANASYVADGRWKFVLSAIRREPCRWSLEDTRLLADLVERIHLRLERAHAEERLTESKARFRSIFHDAAVPMEVSMPDGRFAQVNRAFCELLGYSEAELLATTFDAITYPEEQQSLAREPLRSVMDGTTTAFRAEKRYIRKDGLVVWVDLSVSVVRDADGKPLYFIGQVQDITGRKQAEASLRKSENMLTLAVEAGQLGIWNWDQFTRTLVWSERCNEMTGLPPGSEISVASAIDTIHPEERARVHDEAQLAVKKQTDIELEYRTLWPDGTVRWLQTRGRAIYDAADHLVRITGIIQDVTERRESEEALRRFNTQLESLVDARTEVIKMTMRELQREFAERRRLEEEILEIGERAQARIGQDLHDDLGQQLVGMTILMGLLSSQLAAESHPRAMEADRLQTFLTGIISTTRNLAKSLYPVELERGGLGLSLQELANRTGLLAGVTCKVNADPVFKFEQATEIHLYRIVQESISNALKHGKARNIVIDCKVRYGVSTLTVTDDGSGFEPPKDGERAGIGLHLFQYRARLIGAKLTVTRADNGGCQVRCVIGEPETSGKQSLQT